MCITSPNYNPTEANTLTIYFMYVDYKDNSRSKLLSAISLDHVVDIQSGSHNNVNDSMVVDESLDESMRMSFVSNGNIEDSLMSNMSNISTNSTSNSRILGDASKMFELLVNIRVHDEDEDDEAHSRRVYTLEANSSEEAQEWIDILCEIQQQSLMTNPPSVANATVDVTRTISHPIELYWEPHMDMNTNTNTVSPHVIVVPTVQNNANKVHSDNNAVNADFDAIWEEPQDTLPLPLALPHIVSVEARTSSSARTNTESPLYIEEEVAVVPEPDEPDDLLADMISRLDSRIDNIRHKTNTSDSIFGNVSNTSGNEEEEYVKSLSRGILSDSDSDNDDDSDSDGGSDVNELLRNTGILDSSDDEDGDRDGRRSEISEMSGGMVGYMEGIEEDDEDEDLDEMLRRASSSSAEADDDDDDGWNAAEGPGINTPNTHTHVEIENMDSNENQNEMENVSVISTGNGNNNSVNNSINNSINNINTRFLPNMVNMRSNPFANLTPPRNGLSPPRNTLAMRITQTLQSQRRPQPMTERNNMNEFELNELSFMTNPEDDATDELEVQSLLKNSTNLNNLNNLNNHDNLTSNNLYSEDNEDLHKYIDKYDDIIFNQQEDDSVDSDLDIHPSIHNSEANSFVSLNNSIDDLNLYFDGIDGEMHHINEFEEDPVMMSNTLLNSGQF